MGGGAVSGAHNWRSIGGGDNRGGGDTIGLQGLLIALGEALVIELILGHRVSQGHTIGLSRGGHRGSKGAAENRLVGGGLGGVHWSASVDKGGQGSGGAIGGGRSGHWGSIGWSGTGHNWSRTVLNQRSGRNTIVLNQRSSRNTVLLNQRSSRNAT